MLQTLEGVLVALLMAMGPGDRLAEGNSMAFDELNVEAIAACEPYSNEMARRNCVARLVRAFEADEAKAPFTEQVSWVVPSDPGMPDRSAMLRRAR
ncbi:MAG TPA: hypothetical protein VHM01_08525 [Alphaproteobacteria bacterium]|nr:hypothetical protein [Alphaproteobacteria bacterium]